MEEQTTFNSMELSKLVEDGGVENLVESRETPVMPEVSEALEEVGETTEEIAPAEEPLVEETTEEVAPAEEPVVEEKEEVLEVGD